MRRQAAEICDIFNPDADQRKLCAIVSYRFKRNAREPQKAGRITRLGKSLRERRLHQVEIRFGAPHHLVLVVLRALAMWRLPLRGLARNGPIVMIIDSRRPAAATTVVLGLTHDISSLRDGSSI